MFFPGPGVSRPQCSRDGSHLLLTPGFTDVHVHLREPGFLYKETIASGTAAAARGGYVQVCSMPNINPVPDCREHLEVQQEIIANSALVRVRPFGAITKAQQGQQLADLAAMAPHVAGFSDDGHDVADEGLLQEAMRRAKRLGLPIVSHCEDEQESRGGCIHAGDYARAHQLPGISSASEWRAVARQIGVSKETGCALHICHISCQESATLIRRAKAEGLDITCETAPHYLLLDDSMLRDEGAYRMNPPIRTPADRQALLEGLQDGTIDMIATDHAPHSAKEKSGGLLHSLNGIVGLECAFALLYTHLVRPGVISLQRLIERIHTAPNRRFQLPSQPGDWALFDVEKPYPVDPQAFVSRGRSTPFAQWEVYGRCLWTACGGKTAWADPEFQQYVQGAAYAKKPLQGDRKPPAGCADLGAFPGGRHLGDEKTRPVCRYPIAGFLSAPAFQPL